VGCNPGKGAPSAPIFCYAEPPQCSKSGLGCHFVFFFTLVPISWDLLI